MTKEQAFEILWKQYPKRLGKKAARKTFMKEIRTKEEYEKITTALKKYLEDIKAKGQDIKYVQHGSTWFNNWEDWWEYEEDEIESNVDKLEQAYRNRIERVTSC